MQRFMYAFAPAVSVITYYFLTSVVFGSATSLTGAIIRLSGLIVTTWSAIIVFVVVMPFRKTERRGAHGHARQAWFLVIVTGAVMLIGVAAAFGQWEVPQAIFRVITIWFAAILTLSGLMEPFVPDSGP